MSDKKKMGRPIIGEPKKIRLEIRLDASTFNKLNELSKKHNVTKSEYLRLVIEKQ